MKEEAGCAACCCLVARYHRRARPKWDRSDSEKRCNMLASVRACLHACVPACRRAGGGKAVERISIKVFGIRFGTPRDMRRSAVGSQGVSHRLRSSAFAPCTSQSPRLHESVLDSMHARSSMPYADMKCPRHKRIGASEAHQYQSFWFRFGTPTRLRRSAVGSQGDSSSAPLYLAAAVRWQLHAATCPDGPAPSPNESPPQAPRTHTHRHTGAHMTGTHTLVLILPGTHMCAHAHRHCMLHVTAQGL